MFLEGFFKNLTLLRFFLVIHCVLAFNHYMSSSWVQITVENESTIHIISQPASAYTKIEKKSARLSVENAGPVQSLCMSNDCTCLTKGTGDLKAADRYFQVLFSSLSSTVLIL